LGHEDRETHEDRSVTPTLIPADTDRVMSEDDPQSVHGRYFARAIVMDIAPVPYVLAFRAHRTEQLTGGPLAYPPIREPASATQHSFSSTLRERTGAAPQAPENSGAGDRRGARGRGW